MGLARNKRLGTIIGKEMRQAHILDQSSGKAARVCTEFSYRTRKSWARALLQLSSAYPWKDIYTQVFHAPRC